MKNLLRLLPLFAALVVSLAAADDKTIAAVRAADDARIAATIAVDKPKLGEILADEMRYAHSSGAVDTKASYMAKLADGSMKYFSVDYEERNFTVAGPGVVLMTGKAHFKSANDGKPIELYLGFLAVWREDHGQWRFLAWQSCRLPVPEAAK
ncbi:MAG TPA: nuclear transport factor 2 family protein [Candidatus Didemnitutus sp.]|nr:nuclear transport factor 2 family protein [Candidatus Didemnitutus sp.]